jgi:osmoprotectant transport system substrate-binding protein
MGRNRPIALVAIAALLVTLTACREGPGGPLDAVAPPDGSITVGSFDFSESRVLAEAYSQVLEGAGYQVRRVFGIGPRELVAPALARGLVELVPEYLGTALQFQSLGAESPGGNVGDTHARLLRRLEGGPLTALAAAPAQDSNAFVVSGKTAREQGLHKLSDLATVAPKLRFGGPPECPTRPFCLLGLQNVYGLSFREVLPLDAGGARTRQALDMGAVDVALLFTTDPAIDDDRLVALVDDRGLQPAENVTPLIRKELVNRAGQRLVEALDGLSGHLTTSALRELNAAVAVEGADVAPVVANWLRSEGLHQ